MRSSISSRVRDALRAAAEPAKAEPMRAYMKSEMPFLGVTKPARVKALRPLLDELTFPEPRAWADAVRSVWDQALYREERYAALALARHRRHAAHRAALGMDALPLYQHLVVSGAWWDLVDETALNLVQELLRLAPRSAKAEMRRWCKDADLWKRRTAIICQVGRSFPTDVKLLFDCIDPNLEDRDFFIRKAIGWGLRDLAWTEPDTVRGYVDAHEDRLSGLSRREALKNVGRAVSAAGPSP